MNSNLVNLATLTTMFTAEKLLPSTFILKSTLPYYIGSLFNQRCFLSAIREIRRENEEMMLVRVPDPCFKCREDHEKIYSHCNPLEKSCPCVCHAVDAALKNPLRKTRYHVPYNTDRFNRMVPAARLMSKPGVQNVHPTDATFPYRSLKHPPHVDNTDCDPCPRDARRPSWKCEGDDPSPFKIPDVCNDYAGDVRKE
jgi:hypothetical protein